MKYRALGFAAMTCVVTVGSPGYPNGLYNPPCVDCCRPSDCSLPSDCIFTTCEIVEEIGDEVCEESMAIASPLCDLYCYWVAEDCRIDDCLPNQVRYDCVAYPDE